MPKALFSLLVVASASFRCPCHTMRSMKRPRRGRQLPRGADRLSMRFDWVLEEHVRCTRGTGALSLPAVEWTPSIIPYCTRGRGRLLSFSNVQFSPVIVPVARCLSDSQWSSLIDPCTSLVGLQQSHFTRRASVKDQTSHQSVTENCAMNVNNFTAVCAFFF